VYVLRQCADCWEGVVTVGQASTEEPSAVLERPVTLRAQA